MTIFIIILLLVLGVVLILLEFFVLPGITVAGIAGVVMMLGGIYLSYHHYGSTTGHLTVLGSVLFSLFALWLALKSGTWNRIMLKTEIDSKVEKLEEDLVQIGDHGICLSRLAPMGQIRINNHIVEAKSTGAYVDEQTEVEVIKIVDKVIVVKPIK
ncbi:NfeD family protein [Ancylomarina sp. DW003]|nr:NfeD family protein [Ancylomarina sp. DW003]MDE5420647.1 NfeD family protein [Ancylomarina sp. DW003]